MSRDYDHIPYLSADECRALLASKQKHGCEGCGHETKLMLYIVPEAFDGGRNSAFVGLCSSCARTFGVEYVWGKE